MTTGVSDTVNPAGQQKEEIKNTVNFTGRLDIPPEMVKIEEIHPQKESPSCLSISIERRAFDKLRDGGNLPDLELYVEAIIKSNWIEELDCTEGNKKPSDLARDLMEGNKVQLCFKSSSSPKSLDNVRLNIFIVDPQTLLIRAAALKLRIKPREESLIPTQPDNIGSVLWRLDWEDDMDGPILKINERVQELAQRLQSDDFYAALIVPAVFREVLIRMAWQALEEDRRSWSEDWRIKWKMFIRELLNDKKWDFTRLLREGGSEIDMNEINEIVDKLAEKHKLLHEFINRIRNI